MTIDFSPFPSKEDLPKSLRDVLDNIPENDLMEIFNFLDGTIHAIHAMIDYIANKIPDENWEQINKATDVLIPEIRDN